MKETKHETKAGGAAALEHKDTAPAAQPKDVASDGALAVQSGTASGTEVAVYDYANDASAGMEDIERDEYSIPFLKIVQSNSPAHKPKRAGGLEAPVGSIHNTATGEIYNGEEGIDFVPVYRDANYVERYPFGSGEGFVGIRATDDELVLRLRAEQGQFGKLTHKKDGKDTEIIETKYLYWLVVVGGRVIGRVLTPFASTQLKKYKGLMSRLMDIEYPQRDPKSGREIMVKPPMWAHVWHACTVPEKKGDNDFFGWQLSLKADRPADCRLRVNDPIYVAGREFYNLIKSGEAKVDYAQAVDGDERSAARAASEVGAGGKDKNDEEIPF